MVDRNLSGFAGSGFGSFAAAPLVFPLLKMARDVVARLYGFRLFVKAMLGARRVEHRMDGINKVLFIYDRIGLED